MNLPTPLTRTLEKSLQELNPWIDWISVGILKGQTKFWIPRVIQRKFGSILDEKLKEAGWKFEKQKLPWYKQILAIITIYDFCDQFILIELEDSLILAIKKRMMNYL